MKDSCQNMSVTCSRCDSEVAVSLKSQHDCVRTLRGIISQYSRIICQQQEMIERLQRESGGASTTNRSSMNVPGMGSSDSVSNYNMVSASQSSFQTVTMNESRHGEQSDYGMNSTVMQWPQANVDTRHLLKKNFRHLGSVQDEALDNIQVSERVVSTMRQNHEASP